MSVISVSPGGNEGVRKCRDCGEVKPLTEFHISPRRTDGRGSYCKLCFNERSRTSYAKRVAEEQGREVRRPRAVPEGHRFCPDCAAVKPLAEFPRSSSGRAGFGGYCKPCHNARGKASLERRGGSRNYHLRHRYGIGLKDVEELLAEQGGICAICGAPDPEHVDHDHRDGYVRGLLCFNCNGGLGQFRDSIEYLGKAITYLRGTTWARFEIHPGVYQLHSPRRGRRPSRSF
jgi:hypothetical protein